MSQRPHLPTAHHILTWLKEAEVIIQLHAWEDEEAMLEIADALACAPALAVAVVYDHPQALDAVTTLLDRTDGHVVVGMSKVESAWDVVDAAEAGAQFFLAPTFRPEARAMAQSLERVYLPGVFTPTEVEQALAGGCTNQFLFPADILGPDGLADLRIHFPDVRFFPGVNLSPNDLPAYRRAGAQAVIVELPMLSQPAWRQADIITFVRDLVRAWRGDPLQASTRFSKSG